MSFNTLLSAIIISKSLYKLMKGYILPWYYYKEVIDITEISEIRIRVQDKALCDNFKTHIQSVK